MSLLQVIDYNRKSMHQAMVEVLFGCPHNIDKSKQLLSEVIINHQCVLSNINQRFLNYWASIQLIHYWV